MTGNEVMRVVRLNQNSEVTDLAINQNNELKDIKRFCRAEGNCKVIDNSLKGLSLQVTMYLALYMVI